MSDDACQMVFWGSSRGPGGSNNYQNVTWLYPNVSETNPDPDIQDLMEDAQGISSKSWLSSGFT